MDFSLNLDVEIAARNLPGFGASGLGLRVQDRVWAGLWGFGYLASGLRFGARLGFSSNGVCIGLP